MTSRFFPAVERAHPSGLLAVGGNLTREWLLDAYAHGIFPWPDPGGQLSWWSPDPRAILEFQAFHVPRRLARTMAGGRFQVTLNCCFGQVIWACATAGDRAGQTWITPAMIAAFEQLHAAGQAHSVEVWQAGQLAGGIYGVALGGLFAAESMFHRVRDASKVALVHLVRHLQARGFALCDVQLATPHLAQFGVREISRPEYLERLARCLSRPARFGA